MRLEYLVAFLTLVACPAPVSTTSTPSDSWDVVLVYSIDPMRVSSTPRTLVASIRSTLERRVKALALARRWRIEAASPRIIVSLGDVPDLARAKRFLEHNGRLDLEVVDDSSDPFGRLATPLPEAITSRKEHIAGQSGGSSVTFLVATHKRVLERFLRSRSAEIPAGRAIRLGPYDADPSASRRRRPAWRTYVVESRREKHLVGIRDAEVRSEPQSGYPVVSLELDKGAAESFERLTAANIKRRLAVIIDGEVVIAPVIQTRIAGGRVQISMGHTDSRDKTLQHARDLAGLLKLGALPVPLRLESETRP